MEFLKHLKNEWDTEQMRKAYEQAGLTSYELPQRSKGIQFNNDITLSIQGSFGHYCKPRKTLPYDLYREMEFAILKKIENNDEFVPVQEVLNILPEENKWEEYYDGTVYGYVPVVLIEELYQGLKRRYGLKGDTDGKRN